MVKLLSEMAFSRDDYKLRVRERLSGALGEFIKSKLAEKSGLASDRKHGHLVKLWREEASRLLVNNVMDAMLSSLKSGDRGRRKAALEAIEAREIQSTDPLERWAKGKIEAIFGKRIKAKLEDTDLDGFWDEVDEVLDAALP